MSQIMGFCVVFFAWKTDKYQVCIPLILIFIIHWYFFLKDYIIIMFIVVLKCEKLLWSLSRSIAYRSKSSAAVKCFQVFRIEIDSQFMCWRQDDDADDE